MSDEPTLRTKTDVLDLVIGFIVEHERRMDQMVERLERVAEKLSRSIQHTNASLPDPSLQPNHFTLTIDNPDYYEKIKSVSVEWETGRKDFTPELSEIDAILDEIENAFKTNHFKFHT
jgi:uncharacterized coiled-coil protein SlyX